jgi:hypothetical protein
VLVPQTPDDRHRRVLLILLLLAREAALAPEQVDGPQARELAGRGLAGGAAPTYRASAGTHATRPWMCRRRWAT